MNLYISAAYFLCAVLFLNAAIMSSTGSLLIGLTLGAAVSLAHYFMTTE